LLQVKWVGGEKDLWIYQLNETRIADIFRNAQKGMGGRATALPGIRLVESSLRPARLY
jgi:hypothetical protein